MKKALLNSLFYTLILSLFISCERDDICPEAVDTSPKLVVSFFDADNPTNSRSVVELAVREVENDTAMLFRSASRIAIPLKTNAIETTYVFILNPEAESGGLIDTLSFTYATDRIYVSRACGFKVNFLDFRARQQNIDNNPDSWIRSIQVNETTLRNESETHLSIFY